MTDSALPDRPSEGDLQTLTEVRRKANDYLASAKAENTRRAYRADFEHFAAWCASHGVPALPSTPEVVTLYVAAQADTLRVSTIERRLSAINYAHRSAGYDVPTLHPGLRETMKGIRRTHGAKKEGKAPLAVDELLKLVACLPDNLAGLRDRAILLLGFAGAFRRSELVGLDVEDVRFVAEGAIIRVRRSKTDQDAVGAEVGIARGAEPRSCPVVALRAWLYAAKLTGGPLFHPIDRHGHVRESRLSPYSISQIVQRTVVASGIESEGPTMFGAHSLRSGHATVAAREGAHERAIMRQGRWTSERTVRGYIRHASLFVENSSARLRL